MAQLQRLDLKSAIILEDSQRVLRGVEPINNLRRLAKEMARTYPMEMDTESLYKILWKAHKRGFSPKLQRVADMDKILDNLCKILDTDRDTLIVEDSKDY